jgi:hypothetical protein
LRKIGLLNNSYFDVRTHDLQERELRWNIVGRCVYAHFEQRGRRILAQIHRRLPGKVPSAAGSQSASAT